MSAVERPVVLAGGTGGAKLAAGMQELLGERLSVIANTGDDIEIAGVHVCPDPDLITYWLAGQIDERRGWGLRDDTFTTFDRLVELGMPDWFKLSDRDLATCLYRRAFLDEGGRLTDAQRQIAAALGVRARVLPMCDQPVRTRVRTPLGWLNLQEFLILERGEPPVEGVAVEGLDAASPTDEVRAALASADAIVIGPSNPVISIGPILAVPGLREAIAGANVPVVAVSPFIGGHAVKGPSESFMAAVGRRPSAAGVASLYEGLIDAIVCDEEDPGPPPRGIDVLACPTLMDGAAGRRQVAERVLQFAGSLADID
jgi:LPPG:FO 2-phospho-L-lactate transferase